MFGGKLNCFIEFIIDKTITNKDLLFKGLYKKIPVVITPNFLVYLRIFLTLILFFLFTLNINNIIFWTAIIYLVSKILDIIDGGLARYRKQTTLTGQIFDPLADKLLNLLVVAILIVTWQLSALWIYFFICLIIIVIIFFDWFFVLLKLKDTLQFKYLRRIIEPLGVLVTIIFLIIEVSQ